MVPDTFPLLRRDRLLGVGCIALSIAIALMSVEESSGDEPIMRLHFLIPFAVETFTPVTMENIGIEFGRTILFMENHRFMQELVTMLESHPSNRQVLVKGIRLKAKLGHLGDVYFVDKEGAVLKKNSGATFQLSVKELEQLEKKLESFVGVVDVNDYRKYKKEK